MLRKPGVEEWIVRLVQRMYANARSLVRVGEGYSEEFEVKVGVHQGSVLSPPLFIIVFETLSREFRCDVLCENLYADDLVIIAESHEALDLERSNGGERAESKCRKDETHDLWAWTSYRVQASFHVPSVALEWAATACSAHGARELHTS